MNIVQRKSLRELNTFGIEAYADYFISVTGVAELRKLVDSVLYRGNKRFVIGGGSNILFTNDFNGLVISIDIPGIRVVEDKPDHAIVEAGGGVPWHDLVRFTLDRKLYGLENLAMIPGKAGAAPVQNIGAYGAEQKDFFHSLTAVDTSSGKLINMSADECCFGYRQSIFKTELKKQMIVSAVRYKLNKKPELNLQYKELANELQKNGRTEHTPLEVFNAVCALRLRKLPDTSILGNVGSFFKNPHINERKFNKIKARHPDVPFFPAGEGRVKIPAGWLIENSGWKGKRIGRVGVYEKHSLILVNYGGATGKEIYQLACEIILSVRENFDIHLEPEVIIV